MVCPRRPAFTLIETLVVMAIIGLLVGILIPTLSQARLRARMTRAHADLRSVDQALVMYGQDHRDQLPPTRFSCSSRSVYELPVELGEGRYLPLVVTADGLKVTHLPDVFRPEGGGYCYRAPGPAIINEGTYLKNGSNLWVPDDFPVCNAEAGRFYSNAADAPVRYATWSIGPHPQSDKFKQDPDRAPVPSRFWCRGDRSGGVITHFQSRGGTILSSP